MMTFVAPWPVFFLLANFFDFWILPPFFFECVKKFFFGSPTCRKKMYPDLSSNVPMSRYSEETLGENLDNVSCTLPLSFAYRFFWLFVDMYFTIPLQATRLVLASQRCHVFFFICKFYFSFCSFAFYFCTKEALKRFDRGCMLRFCLDLCCLISESFTVDQQPPFSLLLNGDWD